MEEIKYKAIMIPDKIIKTIETSAIVTLFIITFILHTRIIILETRTEDLKEIQKKVILFEEKVAWNESEILTWREQRDDTYHQRQTEWINEQIKEKQKKR